ncbi:MAG: DUF1588 domain-containing protein [Bryobacterales bacterium]|nr:DUF1588 domain-containing protein [Bryobacterales bacterium]
MKSYCLKCHNTKAALGGFNAEKYVDEASLAADSRVWMKVAARVRDSAMPPPGAQAPDMDARTKFVEFVESTLHKAACADGIAPGPALVKRLNRAEYAATIRDLFNIHINAGAGLPADGAGGEGFDNAAETLFISPIHAEKYLEAAKIALNYAFQEPRSRQRFVVAEPGDKLTAEQAARKVLAAFLPRAFRRPVKPEEIERYMRLFAAAAKRGESYDDSLGYALQGVLVSPHFLFRIASRNPGEDPRLLDNYEIASRLSYFLWGTMPDDRMLEMAAEGKFHDELRLREQVTQMLWDGRTAEFAEQFTEQWLNTRELGRDIKPDMKLFPAYYDAEIQSGIRYEPIIFFQRVMADNLPLTDFIDSNWTVMSNRLQQHYKVQLKEKLRQQPRPVELLEGSHRGGLLSMAAVLAVSSYPGRTSPVLRGKWVLEAMLGTPPPPPPPNVPQLKEHEGASPTTLRERFMRHRADPACATCHDRIDPLGFGLENYDVLGRWRTEDNGKPIDATGVLPDGTKFDGVDGMKQALMARKDQFVRNLTRKLLAYALGRGLTLEDECTVDAIVEEVRRDKYMSHTLIQEIVTSIPFRYQPGTKANAPVLISKVQ